MIPNEEAPEENSLFNVIFDDIVQSRKPVIVHNGFFDMMHVIMGKYRFTIDSSRICHPAGANINRRYMHCFLTYTITNIFLQTLPPWTIRSLARWLDWRIALWRWDSWLTNKLKVAKKGWIYRLANNANSIIWIVWNATRQVLIPWWPVTVS